MIQRLFLIIKIASSILITISLLLELYNIYLYFINGYISPQFNTFLLVVNIILISHVIEGIIAAFNANIRQKNPLKYGIYTFFVGFIALQELFSESTLN